MYVWALNFTNFSNVIFGGFLQFVPNVRRQMALVRRQMALVRRCADDASKHLRFYYSVASHIVASEIYSEILVFKV